MHFFVILIEIILIDNWSKYLCILSCCILWQISFGNIWHIRLYLQYIPVETYYVFSVVVVMLFVTHWYPYWEQWRAEGEQEKLPLVECQCNK